MFFFRYLGSELRSRARQAVVIALGLALGVGLVLTVIAASSGVQQAQAGVLKGLYGVGTDVTVSKAPPPPSASHAGGVRIGGGQVCQGTTCSTSGQTIDNLTSSAYGAISYSALGRVARQHGVRAVAGGLNLNDLQVSIPASVLNGGGQGSMPQPKSFTVTGVDITSAALGPYSEGTLAAGRGFGAGDANSDVAVVDSGYATANRIRPGDTITVAKQSFKVIGTVRQPAAATLPDVYIPLARAQALGTIQGASLKGDVNTIYVTAASAADIPAVQREISALLPGTTVTTPASLASQVTGTVASTARLANDLGRWLSVLVLIAAFALAALLTLAAITRRAREFGTFKALGWRSGRIIAQVVGESVATGLLGAAAGIGLGYAGAAIINAAAPSLTASLPTSTGQHLQLLGAAGAQSSSPTVLHTVAVPWHAPVSAGSIGLAVILAVAGGLLAGLAGSWRIAKLRPADALSRIA